MANLYGSAIGKAFSKEINWVGDNIKIALLTSAYTPNQDVHDYFDDVAAFEATGAGYTQGGKALTGKTNTYNASTNTTMLDADDVTWANSTITARYAVVYDDSGATAGQKALIAFGDLGERSSSNGAFDVTFGTDGVASFTVS